MRKPTAAVEFDGDTVLIWIPKALVVMTRQQFVEALKRGKAYRRAEQREERMKPIYKGDS